MTNAVKTRMMALDLEVYVGRPRRKFIMARWTFVSCLGTPRGHARSLEDTADGGSKDSAIAAAWSKWYLVVRAG